MKKTLIQPANLDEFLCRAEKRIFVDGRAVILTPGARDELAKRGVRIVSGPCPEGAACCCHEKGAGRSGQAAHSVPSAAPGARSGAHSVKDPAGEAALKKLLSAVVLTLKNDCGVTDPEQLRSLSLKALEIVRKGG